MVSTQSPICHTVIKNVTTSTNWCSLSRPAFSWKGLWLISSEYSITKNSIWVLRFHQRWWCNIHPSYWFPPPQARVIKCEASLGGGLLCCSEANLHRYVTGRPPHFSVLVGPPSQHSHHLSVKTLQVMWSISQSGWCPWGYKHHVQGAVSTVLFLNSWLWNLMHITSDCYFYILILGSVLYRQE